MAKEQTRQDRINLAERLLQSAEHSSEAEMRNSLSRIYYAMYHLAIAAVGSMAHSEFADRLNRIEVGLGTRFRRFAQLRSRADYNPDFVEQEFGDLRRMQVAFPSLMQEATELYEQLLELVTDDANNSTN